MATPEDDTNFLVLDCYVYDKDDEDLEIPQIRLFFKQ